MQDSMLDEQFIIYNSALGIRDFVMIDRIEEVSGKRVAWLEEPYDMVGPFSIDELQTCGKISFEACIVMSRQKWQEDQVLLRQESYAKQRTAQEKLQEELLRRNRQKQHSHQSSQIEYRELLCLPLEGDLEVSQIKVAYKKLAKEAHPDVGGSHELFVRITEARNALLEYYL